MGNSYGASKIPSLFTNCVLWWPGTGFGSSPSIDDFPTIPTGVTVTPNETWTKDDLGNNKSVMRFDGSTNYVSLSDDASWFMSTGDFTYTFWYKHMAVGLRQFVFGQGDVIGSIGSHWLEFTAANELQFGIFNSGADELHKTTATFSDTTGWHNVAIIRSGSSILLYHDLVSQTLNLATTSVTPRDSTQLMAIGRLGILSSMYFNGNIKDLLIYKGRALTVPELTLLMRRTHPITGTGLIPGPYSYWRGA